MLTADQEWRLYSGIPQTDIPDLIHCTSPYVSVNVSFSSVWDQSTLVKLVLRNVPPKEQGKEFELNKNHPYFVSFLSGCSFNIIVW